MSFHYYINIFDTDLRSKLNKCNHTFSLGVSYSGGAAQIEITVRFLWRNYFSISKYSNS